MPPRESGLRLVHDLKEGWMAEIQHSAGDISFSVLTLLRHVKENLPHLWQQVNEEAPSTGSLASPS